MLTTATDVLHDLQEILRNEARLTVDALKPEDNLQDLGLDSLARVRVLVALERKHGIEVTEKQAAQITTVGDLLRLVETR
ncbi:MAG TPA: acyl carrier protein [Thermoanaerobaculia bacterium]|nr:acyl carrier protein [Thermoanaerobaculia bacterium]